MGIFKNTAADHIREGEQKEQNGDSHGAIASYSSATQLEPHNWMAYHKLGKAFLRMKNWVEAERVFRYVLSNCPQDYLAHEGLGDALRNQDRFPEAESEYRFVITNDPNNAFVRLKLAETIGMGGKIEEAFYEYKECLRVMQESGSRDVDRLRLLHWRMGDMLVKMEELPAAEKEYVAALDFDPNNSALCRDLAKVLVNLDRIQEAESEIRKSLETASDVAESRYLLADILESQGRHDEAAKEKEKAETLPSNEAIEKLSQGIRLLHAGNAQEAESALREAISISPWYVKSHHYLATCLAGTNRLPEAEAEYREIIRLDPSDSGSHNGLGMILMKTNRFQEAETAFRYAISLDPEFYPAHEKLGNMLKKLGRKDEALMVLGEALRLMLKEAVVDFRNGLVAFQSGNYLGSRKEFRNSWATLEGMSDDLRAGQLIFDSLKGHVGLFLAAVEHPEEPKLQELPTMMVNKQIQRTNELEQLLNTLAGKSLYDIYEVLHDRARMWRKQGKRGNWK